MSREIFRYHCLKITFTPEGGCDTLHKSRFSLKLAVRQSSQPKTMNIFMAMDSRVRPKRGSMSRKAF